MITIIHNLYIFSCLFLHQFSVCRWLSIRTGLKNTIYQEPEKSAGYTNFELVTSLFNPRHIRNIILISFALFLQYITHYTFTLSLKPNRNVIKSCFAHQLNQLSVKNKILNGLNTIMQDKGQVWRLDLELAINKMFLSYIYPSKLSTYK